MSYTLLLLGNDTGRLEKIQQSTSLSEKNFSFYTDPRGVALILASKSRAPLGRNSLIYKRPGSSSKKIVAAGRDRKVTHNPTNFSFRRMHVNV